jgi:hypothetical protein
MRNAATFLIAGSLLASPAMANVTFNTFVSSSDIAAVEGQNNVIAFNYAGNEFVGSVYFGANNAQLYSTNLSGGNVQPFGSPIPGASGEVVVGASLGQGGFPTGDIYTSSESQTTIYHYANSGGIPSAFATLPGSPGGIKQIFFDPSGTFGGAMLVTTNNGGIYKVTASGSATLLATIPGGNVAEGMDIASSNYGQYAGQLLVASETSQQVYAISPGGTVTQLQLRDGGNNPTVIPLAETVSTVPTNLNCGSDQVQGFYVANYPTDIQKASACQFVPYLGDTIVTSEDVSNSPLWDLHYNGDIANTFTVSDIGTLPGQSEDGIFVSPLREQEVAPEPASLAVLGVGLAGLWGMRRRRR